MVQRCQWILWVKGWNYSGKASCRTTFLFYGTDFFPRKSWGWNGNFKGCDLLASGCGIAKHTLSFLRGLCGGFGWKFLCIKLWTRKRRLIFIRWKADFHSWNSRKVEHTFYINHTKVSLVSASFCLRFVLNNFRTSSRQKTVINHSWQSVIADAQ